MQTGTELAPASRRIWLAGQLHGRGPCRIVLLPSGVCWELGAGPVHVAWDDVTSVRVCDIEGAWYLAVDARPGSRRGPPRQPWPARLGRAFSRSGSSIPLEAFPVDLQRLAAVVGVCAGVPEQRRDVASELSLAWLMEHPDPAKHGPAETVS